MAAFDGKAFGQEIVTAVRAHIDKTVAPLLARIEALEARQPEKGEKGDPGRDGADGSPGERGEQGPPGKDAEVTHEMLVEAVKANIEAINKAVTEYLQQNPPPAGQDGAPGRDGKDGAGVKSLLIDQEGILVATLEDGRMEKVGHVVGKDGAPGRDGKDGAPGRDGQDGVGFDDLDLVEAEEGVFLRFARGEKVKEFRLPVVVDRGVWKDGSYRKGDGVTWGGSFWIAQKDNPAGKPDTPDSGWRLAVKKGRDASPPKVHI